VKSRADMQAVLAFFEERRGRFHAFRWRDALDHSSHGTQPIGTGDGETLSFQLVKKYGADFDPYLRPVTKPVPETVTVLADGEEIAVTVDGLTGIVTCEVAPGAGAVLTASFEFDVPVRFDTDRLDIELSSFDAADIPHIPVIEVLE
jgi:uncharacterized protein (TIGR02217 family)